jgi:hypothetical protein
VRSPPPPHEQVAVSVPTEDVDAGERRARASELVTAPTVRTTATVLGVAALLVLLTWSLLTDASHLVADFAADTWMISHQAEALRHGTFPALSLTTVSAAFYPVFAFYGGTLFAFGGMIALLVGSAVAAQTIVYLLALAAAYGGWLWLARMAGLRSWQAHAPAILYLTAPYVLTNINVREDLAEVVATSMIPPMVAATLSILRADRLKAGPAAALAASTIFFGGSHNLTLLWGTTILAISSVIVAATVPQARNLVTKRGTLRILAIVIPAMAVNAWYLLPGLAYHADTVIANNIGEWRAVLRGHRPELAVQHLLGLRHPGGLPRSELSTTLPVLAIAWVAVAAVVSAPWRGAWARMLSVLVLLTAGLLTLMVNPRWILALPDPWILIQFSFRLETFVLFGICGSVIVVLRLLDRDVHRWLIGILLPILMLSVISAAVLKPHIPRSSYRPTTNIDLFAAAGIGDYADGTLRKLPTDQRKPVLRIKRADLKQGRLVGDLPATPGALIYTNVLSPSRMIHVEGAHVVARWSQPWWSGWQDHWALVLKIDQNATPGKAHVVIREARSLPIVSGRIISILGLLGLLANATVIARAGWRRRRHLLGP